MSLGENPSVKLRRLLAQSLLQPMAGKNGMATAFQEIVNNSFDAKPSKVYIKLDSHQGKPAVVFLDNGCGFDRRGLVSILSYGDSSRERSDIKTIGANGTGTKFLLALGDIDKTKVTVITRSATYQKPVQISFNFDYLVKLAENPGLFKMEDLITESADDADFYKGWRDNRETGTTVIFTGFDTKKIDSNEAIRKSLAQRLSPRSAKKVFVWNSSAETPGYFELKPNTPSGEHFHFDFDLPNLGNVTFEVYHGGSNNGPMICGEMNSIMEFSKFFATLSAADSKRLGRVWNQIGGHIYIEKANVYRSDDGSFIPQFYEGGAYKEIVDLFDIVSRELEVLQKTVKDRKNMTEKREILCRIASVDGYDPTGITSTDVKGKGPKTTPTKNKKSGGKTGPGHKNVPDSEPATFVPVDVFLVPQVVEMVINSERPILLQNFGTKDLDLKATYWSSGNSNLKIAGNGPSIAIVSNGKPGVYSIMAKGEFGIHTINVVVLEKLKKPFISGESQVQAGREYDYTLENSTELNVRWQLDECPGVTLKDSHTNMYKTRLVIGGSVVPQRIKIFCTKSNNDIIAQKTISIIPTEMEDRPLLITVGRQTYALDFYPGLSSISSIEPPSQEHGLSTILINPVHPELRHASWDNSVDIMIWGIATAAVAHQVHEFGISAVEACGIASMFVQEKRKQLRT